MPLGRMRLIVHGQQAFGRSVLERVLSDGKDDVVAVYGPVTPEGGKDDPLVAFAKSKSIPVVQPKTFRDARVLAEFRELKADLCVMAYVTLFVPEDVLNAPVHGTIQYHPSLLPLHRGPSAINWAIIFGESETGLSIFYPDKGLDTGDLLLTKTCPIGPDDTLKEVYFQRLFPMGVDALAEGIEAVRSGAAPQMRRRQDHSLQTYEGWCKKPDARVEWDRPAQQVYNLIRGCNPQPGAWTTLCGEEVQLFDSALISKGVGGAPGQVASVNETEFVVACGDGGGIAVRRLKPARSCGGAKVAAPDFVAAAGLQPGMLCHTPPPESGAKPRKPRQPQPDADGHLVPAAPVPLPGAPSSPRRAAEPAAAVDGFALTARSLHAAGVRFIFGVVGIPVTQLAPACQAAGVRFISCRNEQAASYAAAAVGFLSGAPGALLTVSGPGMLHGAAGLAGATANAWPMIQLSGSTSRADVGKGGFQELDQMRLAAEPQIAKFAARPAQASDIPGVVAEAARAAVSGRPGGAYVDLPSDLLRATLPAAAADEQVTAARAAAAAPRQMAEAGAVERACQLLRGAQRPLLVTGKGAALGRAEGQLRALVAARGIPFVATPMGKGLVPDASPLSCAAARSAALKGADVVLVVGARLNWILHFGEAPRWAPDAHFILVDPAAEEGERRSALRGHAAPVLEQLQAGLGDWAVPFTGEWVAGLRAKAAENTAKSAARMAKPAPFPLDFTAAYACIAQEAGKLTAQPVWVSEGANTMDIGRQLLSVNTPRSRIDAGTWGTMGVGLGYAMAAAVTEPGRKVICLEGDSAFGFSAMELETLCRYGFDVCVIVFNNGGIYTGSGQVQPESQWPHDPAPTLFVPHARYDRMMAAFGGKGYCAASARELRSACAEAFRTPGPSLINLVIDPAAGVESGSMQAHN
eukprot:TRINITY_DN17919_c0_g3_i2.p1 TRINITY_DN17919_c0_g3~~TRINITY_DN17919_c0_g3_i2.p1  ORF type:complete len:950 (+),score=280.30 TRINITY_DN17919_c0_g3_i2:88-2850(+)